MHRESTESETKIPTRSRRRRLLLSGLIIFMTVVVLLTLNYLFIGSYSKYIVDWDDIPGDQPMVGVVLGGGVLDGQPRPLLRDRLDAAAELLRAGKVRLLLVSGDNRFADYNEPDVMLNYLVNNQKIEHDKIQKDNAGRSTYETCERARKVFGLEKALFVSESTHLPRVLYLCRSFGIEAYGLASDGQSSAGLKVGQRFRESLARTKAAVNIYIIGERTVLGDKIEL